MKPITVALGAALVLAAVGVIATAHGSSPRPVIATAHGSSPRPVIAYSQTRSLANVALYVTGPGGTRELGRGQDPSVAPDGMIVSSSGLGGSGPSLTLHATNGQSSHSFFGDERVVTPLAWSPDSRFLAVSLGARPTAAAVPVGQSAGLAIIDTRTMRATQIVDGDVVGASFAPSPPDRLVYGEVSRADDPENASRDLYTIDADGEGRAPLTTDGRSLLPLWTARGIVYDRELRGAAGTSPTFELWLLRAGHRIQLTRDASAGVIVPRAASTSGNRLIADEEQPGSETPLAMQLSPRRVLRLSSSTEGLGISRDGQTLLLDRRPAPHPAAPPAPGNQPRLFQNGVVEMVPFAGGQATRIVSGNQAAWSG